MVKKPSIIICGAGGIGRAAALILACNNAIFPNLFLGDVNSKSLSEAMIWISDGKSREVSVKSFIMSRQGTNEEMEIVFAEADVVLDCLPGSQAPRIARLAKKHRAHYANLTEFVKETDEIVEIAKGASSAFLLQTGIAPGYVNVLACALLQRFEERFGAGSVESMKMRVGALSQSACAPSYYAYTWSRIGVATEYVKDAIIVNKGLLCKKASLSGHENIIVNGELFEEAYTSGGVANLPQAFQSRVRNIDYKTLRYPGHYQWVKDSIATLGDVDELSTALDEYMQKFVPSIENDRIVMYVQVMGEDKQGYLRAIDRSFDIDPSRVGSKILRAIQACTASALCEAAFYLLRKNPQGAILQSDLDPIEFLNGPYLTEVYGPFKE